jgi:hypothetical protein
MQSYIVIHSNHPWFTSITEQLIVTATSVMEMSWDEFISDLKKFYPSQPCFLAGSLLHASLTKFHFLQSSSPPPEDIVYSPSDIDIWIHDENGFETKEMEYEDTVRGDYTESNTIQKREMLRLAIETALLSKNAKINMFNVIHSTKASSLKNLLNSFDLDCLRVGYDIHKNEFLLHKDTLPSIASLKTKYTPILTDFPFDPFSEHIVIMEYNSSLCVHDNMRPKYPLIYLWEDLSVFTSETCLVDSHPCLLLERIAVAKKVSKREMTLDQFVYDYMWNTIRNLNIDLNCKKEVKRVEKMGALFDPKTFQYYIPSTFSVLDFAEFFDCPLFTPSTIKEWYKKGGVLVISFPCPKLFLHFSSHKTKLWLCNSVCQKRFSEEDVRFLLYEAQVPAEDIFNVLNPYYFNGTSHIYECNWGYGIMTAISKEVHSFSSYCDTFKFFQTYVVEPLSKTFWRRIRVCQRTAKYIKRGYKIVVDTDPYGRMSSWLWMYGEVHRWESMDKIRLLDKVKDFSILKYLYTFFPQNFQVSLSNEFVKQIHEEEGGEGQSEFTVEEKHFYTLALHPMIIDNRIFRLVTTPILHTFRKQLKIPEESCIRFIPSIFHPKYSHMNLPHIICCQYTLEGREKKIFLRVHEEDTFYGMIKTEINEFGTEDSGGGSMIQYNLLKKMFEIAELERSRFCNYREHLFSLWNLLGPIKDILNYIVHDQILKKVYIVSVSAHINVYCGKNEETIYHSLKRGFLGFDSMEEGGNEEEE